MAKKKIETKANPTGSPTETAEEKVKEYSDKVTVYQGEVLALKIDTDDAETKNIDRVAEIERMWDEVEKKRTEIVNPINVAVKKINALFKPVQTKLKSVSGAIRDKLAAYHDKKKAEAEEANRIALEQQRIAAEEAAQNQITEEPSLPGEEDFGQEEFALPGITPDIPEVEKSTKTESGAGMSYIDYYEYEVVDESKVDKQYWMLNHEMIQKVVDAGVHNLAGIVVTKKTRTAIKK